MYRTEALCKEAGPRECCDRVEEVGASYGGPCDLLCAYICARASVVRLCVYALCVCLRLCVIWWSSPGYKPFAFVGGRGGKGGNKGRLTE
jgi:hypothetical protein